MLVLLSIFLSLCFSSKNKEAKGYRHKGAKTAAEIGRLPLFLTAGFFRLLSFYYILGKLGKFLFDGEGQRYNSHITTTFFDIFSKKTKKYLKEVDVEIRQGID
ncbi:hypothetical protein ACJX0J_018316 [Zea mays]